MQRFVDVSDGKQGIALLNNCLTEYELANDTKSTLFLTLFRAMGNMIVTWWEAVGRFENQDGSQVQRKMEFQYAICPHEGDWQEAEIYKEAAGFNMLPASYQICGGGAGNRGGIGRSGSSDSIGSRDLPISKSFLEISNPNIVLSALKLSEKGDGIILRVFNPTSKTQETEVITGFEIQSVCECNLAEKPEQAIEIKMKNNGFKISCPAGKIKTFRLDLIR